MLDEGELGGDGGAGGAGEPGDDGGTAVGIDGVGIEELFLQPLETNRHAVVMTARRVSVRLKVMLRFLLRPDIGWPLCENHRGAGRASTSCRSAKMMYWRRKKASRQNLTGRFLFCQYGHIISEKVRTYYG